VPESIEKQAQKMAQPLYVPKLSESKLHELAWSLDIKERVASGMATDADRELSQPREEEDVMSPVKTAASARASSSQSLAQQIEKMAKDRARTAAALRG
jgi:hypothetical protein